MDQKKKFWSITPSRTDISEEKTIYKNVSLRNVGRFSDFLTVAEEDKVFGWSVASYRNIQLQGMSGKL